MVSRALALPDDSPENIRRVFVLSDLDSIASQADERMAIHNYALESASEIMRTGCAGIPNTKELEKLVDLYGGEAFPRMSNQDMNKILRQQVEPQHKSYEGVSEKRVVGDVLSPLHPDHQINKRAFSLDALTIFKAITAAKQDGDTIKVQGLYATTLISHAKQAKEPTITDLEVVRYKAFVALRASEGRFTSMAQVHAWKKKQLELAPYKARIGLLTTTIHLFGKAVGADSKGIAPNLPSMSWPDVINAMEAAERATTKSAAKTLKFKEIKDEIDIENFDRILGDTLGKLEELFKITKGNNTLWMQTPKVTRLANALEKLANSLGGEEKRKYSL